MISSNTEAVILMCSVKKLFLKISEIHRKIPVLESILIKFSKIETLTQVFSCEVCEIFKSTSFYRTPLVAASGNRNYFTLDLHLVR